MSDAVVTAILVAAPLIITSLAVLITSLRTKAVVHEVKKDVAVVKAVITKPILRPVRTPTPRPPSRPRKRTKKE